jgi:hypothetical protein
VNAELLRHEAFTFQKENTMRSTLLFAGLLTVLVPAAVFGQSAPPDPLKGTWTGATAVMPAQIEVDFRLVITRGRTDDFAGSISFPAQGSKEYRLDSVIHEGSYVAFSTTDESDVVSSFDGQLSTNGNEVKGKVRVRGKQYDFAMKREGVESASRRPKLQKLSQQGGELKTLFNQENGNVRLVLVLAPTNGTCRMGATLVQRYVLDQIQDPRLSVYVAWEPGEPGDTEQEAQAATNFLNDPRVHHFWSGNGFAGAAFKSLIGFQGESPVNDVYLLFPAEERWTDAAPKPVSFRHYRPELPKERVMNGQSLAGEIKELLTAPRPTPAPN